MTADVISYALVSLLLIMALFRRAGVVVLLLVLVSFVVDRITFKESMYYYEIADWAQFLALKDIIIALLISIRGKTKESIIALGFFVSCLVHQWIRIEALNHDLTLLYYRNDLASIIVASWIASISLIIFTGDSNNGGKRVRVDMSRLNRPYRNRIYNPAYKVTK